MEELPDFTGQVLHLGLTIPRGDEGGESLLVELPEWRRIDGRLFVAGRVPEYQANTWLANREILVAWDTVSFCVQFRSREQYLEAIETHGPSIRERLGW